MLDVFLCHSRHDRQLASAIATRLDRTAEVTVRLEACPSAAGRTIVEAWETGSACAAILLLLSPNAVPERLRREDWHSLLRHVERGAAPPVCTILAEDCRYPGLLERRHFYRWSENPQETLRSLIRWLLGMHPQDDQPSFAPASLPWFEGRRAELNEMWEVLVDGAGSGVLVNSETGSGKTSLAQAFARTAMAYFRDIVWIDCSGRSQLFIASELALRLGAPLDGSLDQILTRIEALLTRHRLLIVLDNAQGPLPVSAPREGRASLLITTRGEGLELPEHANVWRIPNVVPPALEPFENEDERRLWQAMTACRPNGLPLALAGRIAGLDKAAAVAVSKSLAAKRWIDPIDAADASFRLSGSAARPEENPEGLRRRHAETLSDAFAQWWQRPEPCAQFIAEVEPAFRWAMGSDWNLAVTLVERCCAFLKSQGRWLEAAALWEPLLGAAREKQDPRAVETCSWELSWLRDDSGDVRRPMATGDQLAFDF